MAYCAHCAHCNRKSTAEQREAVVVARIEKIRRECEKRQIPLKFEDLISEKELQILLGVGPDAIAAARERNRVQRRTIGRTVFWSLRDVATYVERAS